MAGPAIPARLVWTIDQLDVRPTDRLLEIGCGRGVAVSLICARLTTGSITAIDRSPVAIKAAQARNRDHIAAGKATFHIVDLSEAGLAGRDFDKIFAVNVNVFWTDGEPALAVVQRALAPRGTLHLAYEPPTAGQLRSLAKRLTSGLEDSGFAIVDVQTVERTAAPPLICVTARARREPSIPRR